MDKQDKSYLPELGIGLVVDILLFLFPYGAEQMNLHHVFWLGVVCWIVGIVIAVRMFWIFPLWRYRSPRGKAALAAILLLLFATAVYRPVAEAYRNRNREEITSTVPPLNKPNNPSGGVTQKTHDGGQCNNAYAGHDLVQNCKENDK